MTERIREFLRNRREDGPCLVVDLDVVRDNYAKFARALPDTRVFYAVKANPEPLLLKLLAELGSCSTRPRSWRSSSCSEAGATPDRISFGNTIKKERDIVRALELGCASSRSIARPRWRRCPRRGPHRRRGREGLLPHPVRLRRRRMAAVAEVRLRAGDGGRRARARVSGGSRSLRRVVPRGLAAAQHGIVGRGSRLGLRDLPRMRAERGIHLSMVNLGGGFPAKYLKSVPAVEAYGEIDLPPFPSTSATVFRRRSSSQAAAWSAMRASSRPRSSSSRRRAATTARCAGSISTSASSAARRNDGRIDPVSDPHRARGRPHGPERARGTDLRLGRRSLREGALHAALLAGDRRQGADRGHGRYTTTYSAVAFNGFPPLKTHVI